MKKFVRGKLGRSMSMLLMVLLMLPSLTVPLATRGFAAIGGRQNILFMPLTTTAADAPGYLSAKILQELQIALAKQPGVNVSELSKNSPIMKRAMQQVEDASKAFGTEETSAARQLLDRYSEAADASAPLDTRKAAAGYLIRTLGVDALVFGVIDKYEFTQRPDKQRTYIHVAASKVTLAEDDETALITPLDIIGRSRELPDGGGLQVMHDREAIQQIAQSLAQRLLGTVTKTTTPETVSVKGSKGKTGDDALYPGDTEVSKAKPKHSLIWIVLPLLAVAALAGGGGGGGGSTPPTPGSGTGYASPNDNGYITLTIAKPSNFSSVTSFQLWRESLGAADVALTMSRGRDSYQLVKTIARDNVTLSGSSMLIDDDASSSSAPQSGYLYAYKVIALISSGSQQTFDIYNGQVPELKLSMVGPNVPPPVRLVQVTENANGRATLHWDMADQLPSFVDGFIVQRKDSGQWVTVSDLLASNIRDVQIVLPTADTVYQYTVRAVAIGGYMYPTILPDAIVQVSSNTSYKPDAPTGVTVSAEADSADADKVNLRVDWSPSSDTLVTGYEVYRAESGAAQVASSSGRGILSGSSRAAGQTLIAKITDPAITTALDTQVVVGKSYIYYVSAVAGTSSSAQTAATLVVTPSAPTGVTVDAVDDTVTAGRQNFLVAWQLPADPAVTGYEVYRSSTSARRSPADISGPKGKQPVIQGGHKAATGNRATIRGFRATGTAVLVQTITRRTVTSYLDTDLIDGTTYTYTIKAVYVNGVKSGSSSAASLTYNMLPGEVGNLHLVSTNGTVKIGWVAPTKNADGLTNITDGASFEIYRSTTLALQAGENPTIDAATFAADFSTKAGTVDWSKLEFTDTSAPVRTLVSYVVRPVDAAGQKSSGPFPVLQVTPLPTVKAVQFSDDALTVTAGAAAQQLTVTTLGTDNLPLGQIPVTLSVVTANAGMLCSTANGTYATQIAITTGTDGTGTVYWKPPTPGGTVYSAQLRATITGTSVTDLLPLTIQQPVPATIALTFDATTIHAYDSASVVTPSDTVTNLTVAVKDAQGITVPNRNFNLTCSDDHVAYYDTATDKYILFANTAGGTYKGNTGATGEVTVKLRAGQNIGLVTFTAVSGAASGTGSVQVTPGQVKSLTFDLPATFSTPTSGTVTSKDAGGFAVPNAIITLMLNTSQVTITPTVVTTDANGQATFTLTPQQQTSPLNVRVTGKCGALQSYQDVLFVPASNPELVTGDTSVVLSTTVSQVWRLNDNKTGAPLASHAVRAAVTSGSLATTDLTTDANGEVTISFTAPALVSNVTLTFTDAGTSQRIGNTVTLKIVRTAPTNLVVSAFTATQVSLAWSMVTGEMGYQIQRSLDGLTSWRQIGAIAQGFNTFNDDTVDPASEYHYRLLTVDSNGGFSPWTMPVSVLTLPAPPTDVVANGTSASSIAVSWSAMRGATNLYVVQRSLDGETGWVDLGHTTIASPTVFTDASGLTSNTPYYYRVATDGESGLSTWSTVASATTAPVAPNGLAAAPNGGTAVKLTWTNIPGVAYRIQRRSGAEGWSYVNGLLQPNVDWYIDTGLTANTTYYYRIAAQNAQGLLSAWSPEVSITTGPASAVDLQITTVTATDITLAWTNVTGEKGYDLFTNTDGGTTWTLLQSFQPDVTTYTHTGLTAGSIHYYKVEAFSAAGRTPSDIKSATTIPSVPAITGITLNNTTATLTWSDVAGEAGFEIQRSNSATTWPADTVGILTVGPGITTVDDDTLSSGKTYYYRVRAVNDAGKSAWSAASNPVALVPDMPTLTITKVEGLNAFLTWDEVSGATSYEYEISASRTTWPATGTVVAATPNTPVYEVQATVPAQYLARFFIRMRSVNSTGPSEWSDIKELVTADTATKFGTLQCTGSTATTLSLQWGDIDVETGFEIWAKWDFTTEGRQLLVTLPPNVTRYTDTGLIPNTHHVYWVRGVMILPGLPPAYTDFSNAQDNNTMPAKPASITATAQDDNAVLLEWEDVTGADGYEIEYSLNGGGTWTALATTLPVPKTSKQSYTQENAPTARTIKYRVRGVNGGGFNKGDWSDLASVYTGPATPTGLSAVGDGTHVTIQWSNVLDTKFLLERRSGISDWAPVMANLLPANVTKYLDAGLDANTTYYYRIAAVNAFGVRSKYADEVYATTGPASPVTLTLSNITATSVTLTWTNVANETSYEVYRSLDGLTWGAPISTLGVDVTTYTDRTLQAGTTYYYRVDALSAVSKTSSDVQSITTAPLTPTVTAVASTTEAKITLTWTAVTGATGYEVQMRKKTDAWPADAVVDVFDEQTLTTDFTSLDLSTVYEFRVRAVNDGGKSAWSTPITSATTLPAAPVNVAATPKAADQLTITWDTVPTATGYYLERMKEGDAAWTQIPGPIPQPQIGTPTFTDTGLAVDMKYYYRVQAVNVTGRSDYSAVVSATTPIITAAESFSVAAAAGQNRIYFSQDPDDQLASASLKTGQVIFTGLTAAGAAAFGARVQVTTNRGTFIKMSTDQVLSTDKRSITGTLDQSGQMICKFGGRADDGIVSGGLTLPTDNELGAPTFTAQDVNAGVTKAVTGNTDQIPHLIGPPYRVTTSLGTLPTHAGWPTQSGLLPVVFSVDTVPVSAQVTDLIGQAVMKEMPIWFTQTWTPWQDTAPYDYNGARGHANIAGAYSGPVSLTDENGRAQAGFTSNHSGVYTVRAFAVKRGYSVSVLDSFNTNATGGLTMPIADDNPALPYLLPSGGTGNATAATVITGSVDLLNKTLAYYDHWQVLSVSDGKTTATSFTSDPKETPPIIINCDGSQTARITFTATDEDGKKVLPGRAIQRYA